jgi:hypothetical protein
MRPNCRDVPESEVPKLRRIRAAAVKIVRKWTGADERTVKNWFAGISGPSGQHLVDLIRHSDNVMEVLLILAGRHQIVAAQKLVDVRNKFAETVEQIDTLMGEENRTR